MLVTPSHTPTYASKSVRKFARKYSLSIFGNSSGVVPVTPNKCVKTFFLFPGWSVSLVVLAKPSVLAAMPMYTLHVYDPPSEHVTWSFTALLGVNLSIESALNTWANAPRSCLTKS